MTTGEFLFYYIFPAFTVLLLHTYFFLERTKTLGRGKIIANKNIFAHCDIESFGKITKLKTLDRLIIVNFRFFRSPSDGARDLNIDAQPQLEKGLNALDMA